MSFRTIVGATVLALTACGTAPGTVKPSPPATGSNAPAAAVTVLRGRFVSGEQPDGNSVLLRASDATIVVDSGRHAPHRDRILAAARATGLPIAAIINTHWHLDHIAGNPALRAAYPQAPVYASPQVGQALSGFLADYRRQLLAMIAKAPAESADVRAWQEEVARIDAGERLLPTRPVLAGESVSIAGRRLQLGLERNAASGGDVWVLDPASRTLIAGDLVTLPAPLFDTACAEGWREALGRLDAVAFEQLVPGHGAPMTHVQFAQYRAAFGRLLDCAAGTGSAESCRAGWMHDAVGLIEADDTALANSLLDYYIGQVLRGPATGRAKYCRADPPA